MRVHILGTGAMACLFGARLSRVADVTLLGTWREGISAIDEKGIRLDVATGREVARVCAVAIDQRVSPAPLVLVLVKSWQTDRVALHVPRLLAPGGHVLTLQNGLGNAEKLGPRALAGVTSAASTLTCPGEARVASFGETSVPDPTFIADLLRSSGLPAVSVAPARAMSLVWGKLAVNAGINAVTALLDIPNGELLSRPDARTLMEGAALETAAVARAKGIALPFSDAAEEVRRVAAATASNISSMLQDVRRGTPTELEAINGAVVREGARAGVPTPVNENLRQLVAARVAA